MHSQVATHVVDNYDIEMSKTMYDAVRKLRTGNERSSLTSTGVRMSRQTNGLCSYAATLFCSKQPPHPNLTRGYLSQVVRSLEVAQHRELGR
jgi:hypothetical protein